MGARRTVAGLLAVLLLACSCVVTCATRCELSGLAPASPASSYAGRRAATAATAASGGSSAVYVMNHCSMPGMKHDARQGSASVQATVQATVQAGVNCNHQACGEQPGLLRGQSTGVRQLSQLHPPPAIRAVLPPAFLLAGRLAQAHLPQTDAPASFQIQLRV